MQGKICQASENHCNMMLALHERKQTVQNLGQENDTDEMIQTKRTNTILIIAMPEVLLSRYSVLPALPELATVDQVYVVL